MNAWQNIDCASIGDTGLFWCVEDGTGEGWIKAGELARDEPHAIVDDNDMFYWPHENGGWISHWQPYPEGPTETQSVAA